MKIFIKVKTRKREEKVEKVDRDHFVVWVKEQPVKDRANREVVRLLADYFELPKSRVEIVSGLASCNKIVKIN